MSDLEVSMPVPARTRRLRLREDRSFAPWVAAKEELGGTRLFWMPASGFPLQHGEKVWITEFQRRLGDRLAQEHGLRAELFLQYKQITPEMGESFRRYAQKCMKLLGLGRAVEQTKLSFPTQEQVKAAVDSGQPFDIRDMIGDYVIWFTSKQPEQQRELFLGSGGLTTLFLPPDPKLKPFKLPFTPALRASMPLFQRVDVDGMIAGTLAMQDAFLEKSKELFGEDLQDAPEYPGLAFILPLLDSQHFFLASAELRGKWFQLFSVYINESRKDKGLILAYQEESFEEVFADTLESMRDDGIVYEVFG